MNISTVRLFIRKIVSAHQLLMGCDMDLISSVVVGKV